MPTNAQAALQAAATVYSGGRGRTTPASVKLLAESLKKWLDHQDTLEDPEPREVALDALAERRDDDRSPELHRDRRGEPTYRVGFNSELLR